MPRIRPYHTPVRVKREPGYINRNDLNRKVEFFEWLLDSEEKDGGPLYLPKKWLAEAYGMLDAVRHVGPRRRAEMQAKSFTPEDRQAHREMWENILGHSLEFKDEDERWEDGVNDRTM